MKQQSQPAEAPTIIFADAVAFDAWLADNYRQQAGVWMKMAKKGSGIPSITSDEAVDTGLCWGWISGVRKSLDETYYLQKYVPRRPRSVWSQVNVEKVEALTAAGKMRQPGIDEVEKAKADGRWQAAYMSQRNAVPPPDLVEALASNKAAHDHFYGLSKTERYMIILSLVKERTNESREARLTKLIVAMAVNPT
jgi:uncharacterized protein YdeI (YjbR/CyaY-like superfamily)